MIVDAHHHLWDPTRRRYPFLDGLPDLRRPFTVGDLWEVTDGRVARTVLVQTVGTREETVEFLATAGGSDGLIAGVVGWVDLTAPDVADQIAELRAGPGGDRLVGIRHQVQDEAERDWLLRPEVARGIRAVAAAGLAYDLLVLVPQLDSAIEVARRVPEARFVLDHLAKPGIAAGDWEPWATGLAGLAALPNVTAKVSGLVTEARWDDWDADRIRPYVEHALAVFGPDRLMYGSDWPVCTVAADYGQVYELAASFFDELSPVWGDTAVRVYKLG